MKPDHALIRRSSAAAISLLLAFLLMHFSLLPAVLVSTLFFLGATSIQEHFFAQNTKGKWLALGAAVLITVGVLFLLVLTSRHILGQQGVVALLQKISDTLDQLRGHVPQAWQQSLPEGIDAVRALLIDQAKEHAAMLTQVSVAGTHHLVRILLALVIASALFLTEPSNPKGLARDLQGHAVNFAQAVSAVFGAQFKVASINALATGLFLLAVLPLTGVKVPFALVATVLTFFLGMVPVAGNLISNTLIVVLGLSVSPVVGIVCLVFLVVSHKLEYLLCARFVGANVGAKTWELLSAMVLLEAIFGAMGFVAAPVLYAWLKQELKQAQLI